jgi:hypothetical protein
MRECRKIPPLSPSESRSISGRRLPRSTPSGRSGREKNIKSSVIVANAESISSESGSVSQVRKIFKKTLLSHIQFRFSMKCRLGLNDCTLDPILRFSVKLHKISQEIASHFKFPGQYLKGN